MYLVIIIVILLMILFISTRKHSEMVNALEFWAYPIAAIGFTVLAFIIVGFLSYSIKPPLTVVYKDQPIVSLRLNSQNEISGSFILGTGGISGGDVEYYVMYTETPQGLKRIKVDAYSSYILETDTESPHIKRYYYRRERKGEKRKWLFSYDDFTSNWMKTPYYKEYLTIVVPKNTITINETYLIDK